MGTQSLSAELPRPFSHNPHHLPPVLLSSLGTKRKMANVVCPGFVRWIKGAACPSLVLFPSSYEPVLLFFPFGPSHDAVRRNSGFPQPEVLIKDEGAQSLLQHWLEAQCEHRTGLRRAPALYPKALVRSVCLNPALNSQFQSLKAKCGFMFCFSSHVPFCHVSPREFGLMHVIFNLSVSGSR